MLLAIAAVVVLVLLAIALLPVRKREGESRITFNPTTLTTPQTVNLRKQQLREESTAIADEYERLAHQAWMEEVRQKASGLLTPADKTVLDE